MHVVQKKIYSIILSAVMLLGLSVTPVLAQSAPSPVYDFNYKIVAVDADTKGVLTENTKRVQLGLLIENNTVGLDGTNPTTSFTYTYNYAYLTTPGAANNFVVLDSSGTLGATNIVKRDFVYIGKPTTLPVVLPHDVVIAGVVVDVKVQNASASGPITEIRRLVQDVVYEYNNGELIPVVLNQVNHINSKLK